MHMYKVVCAHVQGSVCTCGMMYSSKCCVYNVGVEKYDLSYS